MSTTMSTASTTITSPRREDVISGGGSFFSCLERAIRHPIRANDNNNANGGASGASGVEHQPPSMMGTSLVDAISRSTSSDAANQDALNNNNAGTAAHSTPQQPTSQQHSATATSNATNEEENELTNTTTHLSTQDYTPHHISYPLLSSTLNFFSQRRAGIRSRLRETMDDAPSSTTSVMGNSCTGGNNNKSNKSGIQQMKPTLSEEEFNLIVNEYAVSAPFLNTNEGEGNENDGGGAENNNNTNGGLSASPSRDVMEYAGQRALGKTPPGGKHKNRNKNKDEKATAGGEEDLNAAELLISAACVPVGSAANEACGGEGGIPPSCAPYLKMGGNNSVLDEAEIIKRLCFMERSELSALLDSEVERSATFYRLRISELAPPRVDGGTCPTFATTCGELGLPGTTMANNNNYCAPNAAVACGDTSSVLDDAASTLLSSIGQNGSSLDEEDLLAPSQERQHLSFTEMANEILELHAFITTNIIVVRQILIKYDAFVRSLGGTPMGSWYQTTRRQRVKGRSSDFRDLVRHSKLKKLTKAYVKEYNAVNSGDNNVGGEEVDGGGVASNSPMKRKKKRLRLQGLSKAYYKIVDSAEELKKKQRLKWRQSAMHLDEDDDDDGNVGVEVGEHGDLEAPATPSRSRDTTTMSSGLETPLPPHMTTPGNATTPATAQSLRREMETPPPHPPLQPPDYSHLRSNPDIGEDIAYQVHIFKCVQSKTQRSIEKTYSGHISGVYDNFISTIREYFLLGSVSDNLSLMPEYLIMRGKSLKSSLLVVAQWREARNAHKYGLSYNTPGGGMVGGDGNCQWFGGFCGEEQPKPPSSTSNLRNSFALFLNIMACFLYMMNYYIVEPSSTRYANALGSGDAMSGLIIGAMPWAALFSAIAYSVWSNTCYKSPMLMSGVLLTAGNILYATAYRYENITMALCGRFLTGLGGPRSMNRRYIADTTPLAQRTAVNAAFGTATAMGAALGPATAIMLDSVDIQFELPLYGTVYFNGMTGPGFLMGGLWILFTLILGLTFEEPQRSGLQEQVRKEMMETSATAVSSPRSEYEMSNLDASKKTIVKNPYNSLDEETFVDHDQASVLDSFGCPTEGGRELCPTITTFDSNNGEKSLWQQAKFISGQITLPVRICMFLLFSKMFTVESVISACSMVTKNRYGWAVQQVGTLGTIVGCLTIPISIFIGWISQHKEDRVLMIWLMSFAAVGMGLLVDVTDFVSTETDTYNEGHWLAVGPKQYIVGYLLVFCSVQAFDGVVGSVLSKVIPTALATGTLNSGLLATVIGTFGRACGDVFITSVGYINLRQIMNLLFVPSFIILASDLILICYNYDVLTA